ncbi:MAG: phospho-sugar mutase [Deltaproteobacteria bacterium]|nr:phospho-sugar mutase [Deltaproteobacteria bacterium]
MMNDTATATAFHETARLLNQARHAGYIKPETCANACAWLADSFAGVDIDGETVGACIDRLARARDWHTLDDCFFKLNSFGTAGVRGRLAIGTAHFNTIVLGLGVEAHARYIIEAYERNGLELGREKAVILAYDSRRGSWDPASGGPGFLVREAACIYAAHGIRVYLFDTVAPTPELSFSVTECSGIRPYAGGVFTASHNPATDNGFKPYDYYGGQIVHSRVQEIADSISDYAQVQRTDYAEASARGHIVKVGPEIDAAYIEKENQLAVWVDQDGHFLPSKISPDLRVVFSALNGTTQRLIPAVLERRGFNTKRNLLPVEQQCVPDGHFATCPKPNPEEKQALNEAVAHAAREQADMLVATDPDGDRLGVGVRLTAAHMRMLADDPAVQDGYYLLTGNQQLVLLTDYILSQLTERDGSLPRNSLIAKTLVSTDLAKTIADAYGVVTVEPHVGFKYIGEKLDVYARAACVAAAGATEYSLQNYHRLSRRDRVSLLSRYSLCMLFGGEESYGSLIGDYVKDKDAVCVTAMFVEMAGFWKQQRRTLIDRLEEIWRLYGYAREETIAISYSGASGSDAIAAIMADLRASMPGTIAGRPVIAALDYSAAADRPRKALRPDGAVIFEDRPPVDPLAHTGYFPVDGIAVPMFWHADCRVIGQAARLPDADMLMYVLDDGSKIIVRPSGTEPKIKLYVLARGTSGPDRADATDRQRVNEFFRQARRELSDRLDAVARPLLKNAR